MTLSLDASWFLEHGVKAELGMEVLDTKAINSRQTDFDKVASTKSHFLTHNKNSLTRTLKKNPLTVSLINVFFQGRSEEYKSLYVYHFFEDINHELFYMNYSSFLREKLLLCLIVSLNTRNIMLN